MSMKICDKCYKAAAILISIEMGRTFATAHCRPRCYERIYGKEELEAALKAAEDQEMASSGGRIFFSRIL
jgi:hypothetical protein